MYNVEKTRAYPYDHYVTTLYPIGEGTHTNATCAPV